MLQRNTTLESLYRSHLRELQRFARRYVGVHEAEDVVHEAYLHALEKGDVAVSAHPKAYLFRIATNLMIDSFRKARVRSRCAEIQATLDMLTTTVCDGEGAAESQLQLRQVCALLDELPAPCRETFLLYWIADLDQAETAERLGVATRTVERHLVRAKEHLERRTGRRDG